MCECARERDKVRELAGACEWVLACDLAVRQDDSARVKRGA